MVNKRVTCEVLKNDYDGKKKQWNFVQCDKDPEKINLFEKYEDEEHGERDMLMGSIDSVDFFLYNQSRNLVSIAITYTPTDFVYRKDGLVYSHTGKMEYTFLHERLFLTKLNAFNLLRFFRDNALKVKIKDRINLSTFESTDNAYLVFID